ncbi:alpha/beta fold hydrolase [Arcticibacter sp.]|jgi:pimeloyl-ACP methyl ester carboxylesterase|uniref:alpha/beta fold hydrolase n=1 Tax=Arcticibacter sp. TaxID=1872630 RepID=UPI00388E5FC0
MKGIVAFLLLSISFYASGQQDTLSITLENVKYAYPIQHLALKVEGQDLRMAYMDIKPTNPNGKTVMLFHGKNFAGYYWTNVIQALSTQGYRVVVPDQIGFGKSSKPFIHYSFHLLARFNKQLLDTLGIQKTAILGHSMGGMLATRFALLYPERTTRLLLENPIGLEDYRMIIPYLTTEEQYMNELKTTAASVKKYYQSSYFPEWKSEYDYLVDIAAGVTKSADFPRYARVSALTFTMIFEQPVVHEFSSLQVPTVLFIGTADKTIVGKGTLSPEDQKKYGQYAVLGKETARKIRGSKLVEFNEVGHIPHLQIPEVFLKSLLENLN